PNSPWLSEEFVNPLFLRSACIALQKDKKTSFPQGLNGTRDVFIFYLKSIARNLGVGQDGTETLVPPTIQALGSIALDMADKRRDYVPQSQAIKIVGQRFEGHPAPAGTNWLEVLQRNGLFRVDPGQQSDDGNL